MAAAPSIGRATGVEPSPTPDVDAAHALFERHSGRVLSYCLYQLGSREDAEDAMQSAFLYAFRGLRRGVVPQAEIAWLLKIAENVCLTRRRTAARRARIEVPRDLEALQDVIPAPAPGEESAAALRETLAGLPESQRRAILLREWHGLSYREIAAKLELSQSAVETLIFRARRSFVKQRRQLMHGLNTAPVVGAVKSTLAGASAAKLAAAAAAVTAAVLAGGSALDRADEPSASPPSGRSAPAPSDAAARPGAPLSLSHERPPSAARARFARTGVQKPAVGERSADAEPTTEADDSPEGAVVSPDAVPDPGSVLDDSTSAVTEIVTDKLPAAPSLPTELPDVPDAPDVPTIPNVSDVLPTLP